MEGIKFDTKIGLQHLVLTGQKTMFRLPARKFKTSKYMAGQVIAINQAYKDIGISPDMMITEIGKDCEFMQIQAKDSKGWTSPSAVNPFLMPNKIQILSVKTEYITDISDEDCFKEGIIPMSVNDLATLDGCMPFEGYSIDGKSWLGDTPQEAFIAISNKAVKKDAWKNNIVVDVYEFKLI